MKILYNYIEKDELKNNAHYNYSENAGVINITKKSDENFSLSVMKMGDIFFIETNDIELRNQVFKKICEDYLDLLKNDYKFTVNGYQLFNNNLAKFKKQINYEQI